MKAVQEKRNEGDHKQCATSGVVPMASEGILTDKDCLSRILGRAITVSNAYLSPYVDDDLRMLRKIRPAFVGRSAYVWLTKSDDEAHYTQAANWAARVHGEVGQDIVLQSAIFEAIYPQVDAIPIPSWVFEDLDQPVETRNFRYKEILGRVAPPNQGLEKGPWRGGGVPDLMQDEAFRWFYYRAVRYMQAGYEAIHIGQIHLIAGYDRGYERTQKLLQLIRAAASRHARRGWVILDAHGHGIRISQYQLFDFTSRPMSVRCLMESYPDLALIKRGNAVGGIQPGGWHADEGPVMMEVDNWLGYSMSPDSPAWHDLYSRSQAGRWGYDEIAWFARLPQLSRHQFLKYAHRWTQIQDGEWYFQFPVTRSLGLADIERDDGRKLHRYRANLNTAECPEGFGDEDAVAAIMNEPSVRQHRRLPEEIETRPALKTPEPVTLMGQLKAFLGGVPGEGACPWTLLFPQRDGRFTRTFCIQQPGIYTFTIAAGGTQSDLTNQGGVAGGTPFILRTREDAQLAQITFDYARRTVEMIDPISGRDLTCRGDAVKENGKLDRFSDEGIY